MMAVEKTLITIVTATFNALKAGRREQLIRCVQSVAKLPIGHEHLIIDGASTDGTVDVLRELACSFKDVRIISERDAGIYDAYNKGAKIAVGEWIHYLGCDDYIISPENMVAAIFKAEKDKLDFIVSPVQFGRNNAHGGVRLHTRLLGMGYSHQGVIMRKSVIAEFGGFDLRYKISADVDLTLRLHLAARRFGVFRKVFAYFDDGGISVAQLAATREESTRSIAEHLKLNAGQLAQLRKKRLLPFGIAVRYLFHPDHAIRFSAFRLSICAILNIFGLIGPTGRLAWQR